MEDGLPISPLSF